MPVALKELKDVMGKKRAFIVTDSFLLQERLTQSRLLTNSMRWALFIPAFADVEPDPIPGFRSEGCRGYDESSSLTVIIALGGGSAMDAGKIMWVLYEHPEVDFHGYGNALH